MIEKQKVLAEAAAALNKADQPWEVSVEGNAIVARWRWMDATFFGANDVNQEIKDYKFTVTLDDKGKFKEHDNTEQKSANVGMKDGKLSFGTSSSSFSGKTSQKSISFGIGKDNTTGEVGLIKNKFDTSLVKKPIRAYLESCGWKKAGLFG